MTTPQPLATFDGMRTYVGAGDLVPLELFSFERSFSVDGQFSYGDHAERADGTIARPQALIPYRPRKNYIIFVTDGYPDDDFREYPVPGCDCAARGNCPADVDPAAMSCPYPTAPEAAHRLHCGYDATTCAGPVAKIEIVTYSLEDTGARMANEAIAAQANGSRSHAHSRSELRASLDDAMRRILDDAARP